MVRHATALALVMLQRGSSDSYSGEPVSACCWEPIPLGELRLSFNAQSVGDMSLGIDVELPTCPECAVLVDAALEAR